MPISFESFWLISIRSCIQAFEGCTNVRITNNIIGPAGIAADKAQGQWADGVCSNSLFRSITRMNHSIYRYLTQVLTV